MGSYRLASIAQLAREMEFSPQEVRSAQVAKAEELLHSLEPSKAYPLDFVVFRITDYRPKTSAQQLLTGLALQHDLGALIEQVSAGLNVQTIALPQPVLAIDDIVQRFNVTSKTVQRWRRKGLPARRFIFPDGKRRVGFLLSSVERFLANHQAQAAESNISQVEETERLTILRHARRLCRSCGGDQIARRLARITRRSALTILHTLRKHDQEHPQDAILPRAARPLDDSQRAIILDAYRDEASVADLARRLQCPRSAVYRVILHDRVARLSRRKVKFHDDPLYHQADALVVIESLLTQEELPEPAATDPRIPRDLPPFLHELYRTPLLTAGRERALFLKYNFHKYQFVKLRRRLDPELAGHRELAAMESHLAQAAATRNAIVRANLRLVISVARKHLRSGVNLGELISEGNLTLLRAVDGFDIHRGNRFSTYATLALMKGFARAVPQLLARAHQAAGDVELLQAIPDRNSAAPLSRLIARDQVRQILSRLDDRERAVLSAHFGLDESLPATYDQLSQRLGLSRERIRQIEQQAMGKLKEHWAL